MTVIEALTWQNFSLNYLDGPPREVRPVLTLDVVLFVNEGGSRFGLRVPLGRDETAPRSEIAAVAISETQRHGLREAELVGASSKELFYFMMAIVDSMAVHGELLAEAYVRALRAWRDLLRELERMPLEAEIGLFGELLTLDALLDDLGPSAIQHWTGPTSDPHDFRLKGAELEVKATTSSVRDHVINGLVQLVPSKGCRLFIVSWLLERSGPGEGATLGELIGRLRGKVRRSAVALQRFEELLRRGKSWRDDQASMYLERWRSRSLPRLVAVDSACPQITPMVLERGISADLLSLVSKVQYRVNLEGRGQAIESSITRMLRGART